jgi:hypothetical protein
MGPVFVAVLSGLCGGLIGTLVKVADDRKVELRRATIEAVQEFAALASDWFEAAGTAIRRTEEELGFDTAAREDADRLLYEGRKRMDRIAVLVGPDSQVVQTGSRTLQMLTLALAALPGVLSDVEVELSQREASELDTLTCDEHADRYADMQGELFDEGVATAKGLHDRALANWREFTEAASAQLGRGLLPRPRASVVRS